MSPCEPSRSLRGRLHWRRSPSSSWCCSNWSRTRPHSSRSRLTAVIALSCVAPAIIGLLIAIRQPRNMIAWLLLVGALSTSQAYALIPDHGWSLQVGRASWPLQYAWPLAVAFVFPDGRLLSRRWRRVAIAEHVQLRRLPDHRDDRLTAVRPARRRACRIRLPASRTLAVLSWIWVPFWLGIFGTLIAAAVAIRLQAAPLDGHRAHADALDRVGAVHDPPRRSPVSLASWATPSRRLRRRPTSSSRCS